MDTPRRGDLYRLLLNKNDEAQEPIRVNTREEFDDALKELFETGRPIG